MILTSSSAIAALPYPLHADLGYGASLPMGYHANGSVHNVRMEDAYNNNSYVDILKKFAMMKLMRR